MAGQELTRDEVFALAGAFSRIDSAKTLLSVSGFPAWAVPETGYANAREFWAKVSGELASGVMDGGRARILEAASKWFSANEKLAALAAAAAPPAPSEASPSEPEPSETAPPAAGPGTAGESVSIAQGRGFQVGSNNVQINFINHGVTPEPEAPDGG